MYSIRVQAKNIFIRVEKKMNHLSLEERMRQIIKVINKKAVKNFTDFAFSSGVTHDFLYLKLVERCDLRSFLISQVEPLYLEIESCRDKAAIRNRVRLCLSSGEGNFICSERLRKKFFYIF